MKKDVLVIETEKLFEIIDYFEGYKFTHDDEKLYELEKNAVWLDKDKAESDPNYKQLIGYSIITGGNDNRIFFYQRAKNNNYRESRLQEKWSCGIGGHIEKKDLNGSSIILSSAEREISEELDIALDSMVAPSFIGYINDDSNEVGKVHFGLIFWIYCNLSKIKSKDPEIAQGSLVSFSKIKKKINTGCNIENWSKMILPYAEKYFI